MDYVDLNIPGVYKRNYAKTYLNSKTPSCATTDDVHNS